MKKRLYGISILVFLVLLALSFTTGTDASSVPVEKCFQLIGHRGFSGDYPENTIESFVGAKDAGFNGMEIDVWESDDTGDLMIFHDPTTDRMTGKSEFIWRVNAGNREDYKIISGNGYDSTHTYLIPTFEEVLEYAKEADMTVYLHIKTRSSAQNDYKLSDKGANKIIRLIKQYGMEDKVIVFSTKAKVVKPFCNQGIRVGRISSLTTPEEIYPIIDWLYEHNCDTFIITKVNFLMGEGLGQTLVDYCHERNIEIGTYTTPDVPALKQLLAVDCDFSLTNFDLLTGAKGETGNTKPVIEELENHADGVYLRWSAVQSAFGYKIYKAIDDGEFKELTTIYGSPFTDFTDTAVVSGRNYSYKIEAFIQEQKSLTSKAESILFLEQPKVTGLEISSSGIEVSWNTVKGAEGYSVWKKAGDGEWMRLAKINGGNTNSFIEDAQESAVLCTYKVRAWNGDITSGFSADNGKKI